MAVALDTYNTGAGSAVSSVTFTHTPVATPSAAGIAFFGYNGGNSAAWTCTYGGTNAPSSGTQVITASPDTAGICGLANPASGTQTIVVSCPSGCYPCIVSITVTGSDTTTCFDAALGAVGASSTAATVTVAGGTSGDLVFFLSGSDGPGVVISAGGGGSNTNSITGDQVNSGQHYFASWASGAASVTGTNTMASSTNWAIYGASFKVPGVAPPAAKASTLSFMHVG
jgi:hypothetical protein